MSTLHKNIASALLLVSALGLGAKNELNHE